MKTQEQALALRETTEKAGEYAFACGMGMMRGEWYVLVEQLSCLFFYGQTPRISAGQDA